MAAAILETLNQNPGDLGAKALFRELGLHTGDYDEYYRALSQLVENGQVQRQRRRLSLPQKSPLITGIIRLTQHGYGFIDLQEKKSVFIPAKEAQRVLDGDRVTVEVKNRGHEAGPEGRIVEVDFEARRPLLGILRRHGADWLVEVKNGPLNFLAKLDALMPSVQLNYGDWVLVAVEGTLRRYPLPRCKLQQVLGKPDEKGVTEKGLMASFGMVEGYPESAIKEQDQIKPQTVSKGVRADLTDEFVVTIDPADAKDHDDAVSLIQDSKGNFHLSVHIADVSRYVPVGSAIDQESSRRGFSVYLQHHHLPMLPPKLPGEMCSLKPGKDRLALSMLLQFDGEGRVVSRRITPSRVKIQRLISYEVAEQFLDSDADFANDPQLGSALRLMWKLADLLRRKRLKEGGIDFDLPEAAFHWEDTATPKYIFKVPRLKSHQLIEEFMLAANRGVAEIWGEKFGDDAANVFRVHPHMEAEKRQRLSTYLKDVGLDWPTEKLITAKQIAAMLDEAGRRLPLEVTSAIARKALTLARYDTVCRGHFGLGFTRYLHFTSPIRRYADLTVHRLIWSHLVERREVAKEAPDLVSLCAHLSEKERTIAELEREASKLAGLHYLIKRQDQTFPARLVEVYQDRFYVALEDLLIEGELTSDSKVQFQSKTKPEPGRRRSKEPSGRTLAIGDRLMVNIAGIDLLNRKLELRPVW